MRSNHTKDRSVAQTKAWIILMELENNSSSLAESHQWAERTVVQAAEQNGEEIRLTFGILNG